MVCSTVSSGPVMVPISARPIKKWETRCSTTAVALTTGRRISVPAPSAVGMIFSSVSYCVRESVWTGAWGTRPFGIGRPRMPATKVVPPSRKKSQWKPPGFLSGNWRAWAVMLLTFCGWLEV